MLRHHLDRKPSQRPWSLLPNIRHGGYQQMAALTTGRNLTRSKPKLTHSPNRTAQLTWLQIGHPDWVQLTDAHHSLNSYWVRTAPLQRGVAYRLGSSIIKTASPKERGGGTGRVAIGTSCGTVTGPRAVGCTADWRLLPGPRKVQRKRHFFLRRSSLR